MAMNEVEKVEKDDYVKYKDYCISELNSDEVDTRSSSWRCTAS